MLKLARVLFVLLISVFALSLVGCGGSDPEPEAEAGMAQPAEQPAEPMASGSLQEAGVTIESTPIYFAFDRYDLSKDAQNVLRAKAELLKAFPQISV